MPIGIIKSCQQLNPETHARLEIGATSIAAALLLIVLLGGVLLVTAQHGHNLGYLSHVAKQITPGILDGSVIIIGAVFFGTGILLSFLVRAHLKQRERAHKNEIVAISEDPPQVYSENEMKTFLGVKYYSEIEPLGDDLKSGYYRIKDILIAPNEKVEVLVVRVEQKDHFYFYKQNIRETVLAKEYYGCVNQDLAEESVRQSYQQDVPPCLKPQQYWTYQVNVNKMDLYVVAYLEKGQPQQHYFDSEEKRKEHIDRLGITWKDGQVEFMSRVNYTSHEAVLYADPEDLVSLNALSVDADEYWLYDLKATQGPPIFALLIYSKLKGVPETLYFTTPKHRYNYIKDELKGYIDKQKQVSLLKKDLNYPVDIGQYSYWTAELTCGKQYALSTLSGDRFFMTAEERQKAIEALECNGYQDLHIQLACVAGKQSHLRYIQEDMQYLYYTHHEGFITYDVPKSDGNTTLFTVLYNCKSWSKNKQITAVKALNFESYEERTAFIVKTLANHLPLGALRDSVFGVPAGMIGPVGYVASYRLDEHLAEGQGATLTISSYDRDYFVWVYKNSKGELRLDYVLEEEDQRRSMMVRKGIEDCTDSLWEN